jgi:hypothetical protein
MHDDSPARTSVTEMFGQFRRIVKDEPPVTQQLRPGQHRSVGDVIRRIQIIAQRAIVGGCDQVAGIVLADQSFDLR